MKKRGKRIVARARRAGGSVGKVLAPVGLGALVGVAAGVAHGLTQYNQTMNQKPFIAPIGLAVIAALVGQKSKTAGAAIAGAAGYTAYAAYRAKKAEAATETKGLQAPRRETGALTDGEAAGLVYREVGAYEPDVMETGEIEVQGVSIDELRV